LNFFNSTYLAKIPYSLLVQIKIKSKVSDMPTKRGTKKDGNIHLSLVQESYNPDKKRGEAKVIKSLGIEKAPSQGNMTEIFAVVWAEGRTLGNAVPSSDRVKGQFPEAENDEGVTLPMPLKTISQNGNKQGKCFSFFDKT
jgi:hypothetical protein